MSARVQKARKAAHKKRLAEKKANLKGYPEFYANQPLQKVRAAKNEEIRSANANYVVAVEDLQVAQITGEGLEAAQEAVAVSGLIVQNLEQAKRERPGVRLTNAGG
jgi:hypothetical protein